VTIALGSPTPEAHRFQQPQLTFQQKAVEAFHSHHAQETEDTPPITLLIPASSTMLKWALSTATNTDVD
jgi:hypothetical protein